MKLKAILAALMFMAGTLLAVGQSVVTPTPGGGGTPGGSNTQLQYNNNGSFGGTANLTWNSATSTLTCGTGCVVNTSGTGTITPSPAGSTGQVQYNNAGALGGATGFSWASSGTTLSLTGQTAGQTTFSVTGPATASGTVFQVTSGGSSGRLFQVGANNYFDNSGFNVMASTEAPVAAANQYQIAPDATTKTFLFNANNNGTLGLSGAWSNTNVTPVTVSAAVSTPQNLMSGTVPAGTLNRVGRSLRISISGVYTLPAVATTTTIAATLGGVTLFTITDTSTAAGVTNGQFSFLGHATTQTGGATGVFEVHGVLSINLGTTNAAALTSFGDTNTAVSSTVDTTAAQTFQVTVTFSTASASNTATQRQMVLETVN